jgi:hypothetical protein
MASACAGPPGVVASPSPTSTRRPSSSPPSPTSSIPTPKVTPSPVPVFVGTSSEIDPATRSRMTESWHLGCPVPIEDLRLLTMDHWGLDGSVHGGEMVVNRSVAADVLKVFGMLFDAHFPIARMDLVDEYGGDDDLSMAADNTSAFNCRRVTGGTAWSEHAYGWAIDINPVQNPYVTGGGTVLSPAGEKYLDRSNKSPGMIHAGDLVVRVFASIGWEWGGNWTAFQDYQHFSATGK